MKQKTILLVDDDVDFVEAISSFLEANGYRVVKAHDGAQGLKLAKMEHPDLIVMDIVMSERTEGFFTVQELRRNPELKTVPIFVVSSLYSKIGDFGIEPDKGWLAHDEFFSKPVEIAQFLDKIRSRIEERGLGGTQPGAEGAQA